MAKHEAKAGPRICQGCGEWFDAKGAEKVCPNDACADLASKIMKEAKEHEAEIKRYYPPGQHVAHGDQNRVYDHQNWRDNHRPALGAPRARAREENLGGINRFIDPPRFANNLAAAIEWRMDVPVQGEVDNVRDQRANIIPPPARFAQAQLEAIRAAQENDRRVLAAMRRLNNLPRPADDEDFDP